MPKAPGKGKPGRPRKFAYGDLARVRATGEMVVVVGYGVDDAPPRRKDRLRQYRVIRFSRRLWQMYGPARWFVAKELEKVTQDETGRVPRHAGARAIWLANRRLGGRPGRGCGCNCCAHISADPGLTHSRRFDELEETLIVHREAVADEKARKAYAREILRRARKAAAERAARNYMRRPPG